MVQPKWATVRWFGRPNLTGSELQTSLLSLEELKRHAYCKWHNSTSYATNDCNVFHRQVQSAINEGRLVLFEMQIDKAPFPVHTLDLNNQRCLFGQSKPKELREKCHYWCSMADECQWQDSSQRLVREKTPDGKESLKIIVEALRLGEKEASTSGSRPAVQAWPIRPLSPTGQTGQTGQTGHPNWLDRSSNRTRTFKPKRLEVGTWKTNEAKV